MTKQSAGILVYKKSDGIHQVFLAHPGGPFWAKKDSWSIPKGELHDGEDHLTAARREFEEELNVPVPRGELIDLGSLKQSDGKINFIWAVEGDIDPEKCVFDDFLTLEWPPKSGKMHTFAENDRAEWFDLNTAKQKLFKNQVEFIDRLAMKLKVTLETDISPEQSSLF